MKAMKDVAQLAPVKNSKNHKNLDPTCSCSECENSSSRVEEGKFLAS